MTTLIKFEIELGKKIFALEKLLKELSTEVSKVLTAIDQAQGYSYSCKVKLAGIPGLRALENAFDASQLCLRIFNGIGVEVKPYGIDISHRITPSHATEQQPNKYSPSGECTSLLSMLEFSIIQLHVLKACCLMQKSSRKVQLCILMDQKLDSVDEENAGISTPRNQEYEGFR